MTGLELAIEWFQKHTARKNGGRAALARHLHVRPNQVTLWDYRGSIPPEHIPELVKHTKISKRLLENGSVTGENF